MSEWGPWMEHDGSGCPVPGNAIVKIMDRRGEIEISTAEYQSGTDDLCDSWIWDEEDDLGVDIIRYRVRKPRALQQLIEMVESLPSKQKEPAS